MSLLKNHEANRSFAPIDSWERSGPVVECFIRDRGVAGSSLTGGTALCP